MRVMKSTRHVLEFDAMYTSIHVQPVASPCSEWANSPNHSRPYAYVVQQSSNAAISYTSSGISWRVFPPPSCIENDKRASEGKGSREVSKLQPMAMFFRKCKWIKEKRLCMPKAYRYIQRHISMSTPADWHHSCLHFVRKSARAKCGLMQMGWPGIS